MKYNLLGAVSTIALGAAFGIGTPGAANAALSCPSRTSPDSNTVGAYVCSETVSFGTTPTDFSNVALNIDRWLSDAASGFDQHLTKVIYTVSGNVFSTASVTAGSTNTYGISDAGNYSFAPGVGAPTNFLSGGLKITGGATSQQNLTNGQSFNFAVTMPLGPKSVTLGPGQLAGFTGTGTFSALANSHILAGSSVGGGNGTFPIVTNGSGSVSITYDYSTTTQGVPEPASMALLGAGLAGLGVIRRRRKA